VTWWYEEIRDHPLHVFHDLDSMQRVVDDLFSGRHAPIIAAVLDRWRSLAESVRGSEKVVVLDSCLLGYLTWTLFPADVGSDEIMAYVAETTEIIAPLRPSLVYLYQHDIAAALRRVCDRRGGQTEERFVGRASDSPYGRRLALAGFNGLVQYWSDFRDFTDLIFERLPLAKLALENSDGDWPLHERRMLEFLDLALPIVSSSPAESFARLACAYVMAEEDGAGCSVILDAGRLRVDGLRHVWPHTPLIPRSDAIFEVESLPITATFQTDSAGEAVGLEIRGPAFLAGPVNQDLIRRRAQASRRPAPW
jgi:hypothetical protein